MRQTEMAGNTEIDSQTLQNDGGSFEWDEASQLYFHASSGFYHEPNAGWYYSSRDGLYYKFENGNYVLLEPDKQGDDVSGLGESQQVASCNDVKDESVMDVNSHTFDQDEAELQQLAEALSDEPSSPSKPGPDEDICMHENEYPPPPSEWVEEMLINLYLSGYSDPANISAADETMPVDVDTQNLEFSADGPSIDEENWKAQYGQVNPTEEELATKDKKSQPSRLLEQLVRRSTKLHPSIPFSSRLFKSTEKVSVQMDIQMVDQSSSSEKQHSHHQYRDRAAERRMLHGGYGIGPGQKNSDGKDAGGSSSPSSPDSACANKNEDEALNLSFGPRSYARKIIENMGWKEGERLGNSGTGLLEPLQAVGNKGSAGLGWNQTGRFHR